MSVVIVGGNERMVGTYEDICYCHGFDSKVFVKEKGCLRKKLGVPDLFILFTNTVSHKMMKSTVKEAKKNSIPVLHCKSSSASALEHILEQYEHTQSGNKKGGC